MLQTIQIYIKAGITISRIIDVMDTIQDLLTRQGRAEPAEIKIIKNYVLENFASSVQVAVQQRQIIIAVESAALAGTLRMHSHALAEACQTDKRLVIRIN